ncbi:D-glycerate 3-kinase, chloroplastic [Linum perenne]
MAMAGLNSASPLCCSFSAKLHTHDCDYTVSIEISSSRNKPFPFPCSYHCSSSNSSLSRSSKQSRIQTHFSKSGGVGHGCSSWRIGSSLDSAFPSAPAEVAAVENLYEFICSGPLIAKIGLSSETIAESIDKWLLYGSLLCRLFQLNDMYLTEPQKARFYHYYIPVFIWCENQISKHSSQFKDGEDIPPLVIGFSAPQGCGKTTLVSALAHLFDITGRKSATISIDDFYLTAEDQGKLREANPGNALLELRGNAGSHDLPFSVETLTSLCKMTKEGMKMKLPRYNKSAYNGKGDRADPSAWPEVEGPLNLEIVNKNLEAYYDAWDKFVNSWAIIKIQDPSCVYQWRLQAEIAMREAGKPGMTDEEVKDFVSRYLPAYKAYLPTLYAEGPKGSVPENLLVIEIDEARNPILEN